MMSRTIWTRSGNRWGRLSVVAGVCVALLALCGNSSIAAEKEDKEKPRRRAVLPTLQFDPAAEQIELFEGIKSGQVEALIVPQNAYLSHVLIDNVSDKPLTVKLPEAVVGVHILHQFGAMPGFGGGLGGMGGGLGGGIGQGNVSQPIGGGFGGGQGGLGMGLGGMGGVGGVGGGGAGFFSIPPEKTAKIPLHTVCLDHGALDPTPRSSYRLMPLEEFTKDETLRELIRMYASGRVNTGAAQAAAWHLTDRMSWAELAAKSVRHIGQNPVPYFSRTDLLGARNLVVQATARARENMDKNSPAETPTDKPRGGRPLRIVQ